MNWIKLYFIYKLSPFLLDSKYFEAASFAGLSSRCKRIFVLLFKILTQD